MVSDVLLASSKYADGQFVLHLLLLTRQLQAESGYMGIDFDKFREMQYPNPKDNWNEPLFFLNNESTRRSNIVRRLYFYHKQMNLSKYQDTVKVMVYVPMESHNGLMRTKYHEEPEQLNVFERVYNEIKGSDWPECKSTVEFKNLPEWVQREALSIAPTLIIANDQEKTTHTFNGVEVFQEDVPLLNRADITILLSEVVKTKGSALFQQLGLTATKETDAFVDYYVSLHTEEQKQYLLY